MTDADRIWRGIEIRRPKKNAAFKTTYGSSRALRFDNGAYSRLQFLKAISHSLGIHTEAFQVTSEDDSDRDADASSHESVVNSIPSAIATSTVTAVATSDDMCEVCLIEPRDRLALVPCGHSVLRMPLRLYPMDVQFAECQWQAFFTCSCDNTDIEQHNSTTVTLTVAVFSGSWRLQTIISFLWYKHSLSCFIYHLGKQCFTLISVLIYITVYDCVFK